MNNIKGLTLSGMLIGVAVTLQLMPVFISEIFVIVTLFSALPIFIISITNPRLGVLTYMSSAILISIFSIHEGIMFTFTNGVIGIALGTTGFYFKNKINAILISCLAMSISLAVLNYIIGIPVFGSQIPGALPVQLLFLLIFSLIYCTLFNIFAHMIYKYLNKLILQK